MSAPWYENERFWEAMSSALFHPERLAGTPAEVDALMALVDLRPGTRLLDLCCGPGRHSLEFARRGLLVTGVDRTRRYLDRARRRARREGLPLTLRQQDMRAPLGADRFDAAINLFTSFGYFDDPADDRRVLEHLLAALVPGGVLVLEVAGREVLARGWRERDWNPLPGGGFLLQERHLRSGWGWVSNRWILVQGGRIEEFTVSHRLYGAADLCGLLRSVGFVEVQPFGSLEGSPYDQHAQRLVVVGRRAL
ncbi:MAG: class I SAM-dependent methyltransferase [Pseudomonadota bacterium]